ncbi:hypothetical protein [Caproiciproducens faecalis]|uniref:Uncharacterized protein n=1 Tax=Caproiciproducens faecalis TaxID=2820301 RepID=A0ABS7DN31_9FIRM|nr:hypothetical protein [Caproiciproducens faecalis]MBW7572710.1 hypothetical protein [Caproiciproducens faecalis]
MPTNNKTSLGLNSWVGTDKPMRSDFVEDNTLLDTLLTGHFGNAQMHLSPDDRTLLTQPFTVGSYCGDGAATQVITLPFAPRLVLVFLEQMPANDYFPGGGYNENSFAAVTKTGGSAGVLLSADKLTVYQTQNPPAGGGILNNLNGDTMNYIYVAFR